MDVVDWAATPVGPQERWPGSLKTALDIMTGSRFPMVVIWGPEFTLFYNSSYAPMLGSKHPWAMGRSLREVWPKIWETIGPMLQSVLQTGIPTYNEDMLLPLMRNGYLEECYFTFSFSAITDEGQVRGIFCAVTEASAKIIAQRRLRTLYALNSRSLHDVAQANPIDLPFLRIYLRDETGRFVLSESSGAAHAAGESWPLDEVAQTGRMQVVPSTIDAGAVLIYTTRIASAAIFPLIGSANVPMGAIVVGLSPYSIFDESYQTFLNLLTTRIAGDMNGERSDRARALAASEVEGARDVAVRNERVLQMLADAVPQIICTAGSDGTVDYFNRRWFEYTGMSLTQTFEDAGWLRAFHPDDRAAIEEAWRTVAGGANDFSAEARIRSADGEYTWLLHRGVALRAADGALARLFVTATDINDRKLSEEREKFLAHASDVLSSTLDVSTILRRITELCVPQFADWCQLQSLSAEGELIVEAVRHKDPERNRRLEALVGRTVVTVRERDLRLAAGVAPSAQYGARSQRSSARGLGERTGCGRSCNLRRGRSRYGADRSAHRARAHARNAAPRHDGFSLRDAEDYGRHRRRTCATGRIGDRQLASLRTRASGRRRALQQAMLPARLPSHPRVELNNAYRPAERESRVGGDWYDAFAISPDEVALSIGDVAGHGLEASVAMNEARQALRLSALEGLSPAETLRRANAALMINDDHPMITAIYGIVDVAAQRSVTRRPATRSRRSHHLPPKRIISRAADSNRVERTRSSPRARSACSPYWTLLLYTDGLIEFDRNIERESTRLLEALGGRVQDTGADGAAALVRHVLNNRQYDDIAVLAATYLPPQPGGVEFGFGQSRRRRRSRGVSFPATLASRNWSRNGRSISCSPSAKPLPMPSNTHIAARPATSFCVSMHARTRSSARSRT